LHFPQPIAESSGGQGATLLSTLLGDLCQGVAEALAEIARSVVLVGVLDDLARGYFAVAEFGFPQFQEREQRVVLWVGLPHSLHRADRVRQAEPHEGARHEL
jgi:hypothetical protein